MGYIPYSKTCYVCRIFLHKNNFFVFGKYWAGQDPTALQRTEQYVMDVKKLAGLLQFLVSVLQLVLLFTNV